MDGSYAGHSRSHPGKQLTMANARGVLAWWRGDAVRQEGADSAGEGARQAAPVHRSCAKPWSGSTSGP